MNWDAIGFDWNQVRAFLATVEEGSLSAAARVLGQTQPTVGRQVAALEAQLQITLFERAGRSLIPTPAARDMAGHVRAMAEAAGRFSLAAGGQTQSVAGPVKITASEAYSVSLLPGFVRKLRDTHPEVIVEIVSTNSLSDLLRREADIAVRNADPSEAGLIARRVKTDTGGVFATPDLITRHGPFRAPGDLARAPFVGLESDAALIAAFAAKGVTLTERTFVARAASHTVHWELTRHGVGLGLTSRAIGLRTPEVVPVLEEALSFEFPVWLVAPSELNTSRRVRVVFDALAAYLARWPIPSKIADSPLDAPSGPA